MSPVRCPSCERNVALEVGDAWVEDTRFDGDDYSVEVDLSMELQCAECGEVLFEHENTSTASIPGLEEYLEEHEDADIGDADCSDAEVTEKKKITRDGHKVYLAKWENRVVLGRKTFKVKGELALGHDQVNL